MMKTTILLLLYVGIVAFPVGAQNKKNSADGNPSTTLETGVLTVRVDDRLHKNQFVNAVVIDTANATDAICEVIQDGISNRSIVNAYGEVIGSIIRRVLRIHDKELLLGSELYREHLSSWELSRDEKYLMLSGPVPESHRGGSQAVQFIAVDTSEISNVIKCAAYIIGKPVMGEGVTAWLIGIPYFGRETTLSLMKINKAGEAVVKIPVDVQPGARIHSSPNGEKLLLSTYRYMMQTDYLFDINSGSTLIEVNGLHSRNVWLTNQMIFSTDGATWLVFDVENHEADVKSGRYDTKRSELKQCFSLPDERVLMLFSNTDTNSPSTAVIFDWKTNTTETYWIRCPMNIYGPIRCGINREGDVWIYGADASVLLSRE